MVYILLKQCLVFQIFASLFFYIWLFVNSTSYVVAEDKNTSQSFDYKSLKKITFALTPSNNNI